MGGRKGWLACLLCVLLCLGVCGCARFRSDEAQGYLAVLDGAFVAETEGVLNGTAFSARIEARPTEGQEGREIAVIFYAPEEICGTEAVKREDGSGYLRTGGVVLEGGGLGMAPLFDLFLKKPDVTGATLEENGHTTVRAQGMTLTLLPDGTPYTLSGESVSLTVISWRAEGEQEMR